MGQFNLRHFTVPVDPNMYLLSRCRRPEPFPFEREFGGATWRRTPVKGIYFTASLTRSLCFVLHYKEGVITAHPLTYEEAMAQFRAGNLTALEDRTVSIDATAMRARTTSLEERVIHGTDGSIGNDLIDWALSRGVGR